MKRFGKLVTCSAILVAALFVSISTANARVEAGMLTCEVDEGLALILSKPRDLHCVFHKSNGQSEAYKGKLREIGLDIGVSGRGVIAWAVLAQTTELPPGELAGSYGGVEAGAAAALGGRGQVMIGGSRRTISLQPLSIEGEIGLNIAVGITSVELHPLFRGRVSGEYMAPAPAVGYTYDSVPHARQHVHYGCGSYTHLQHGQTLYGLAHACGVTVEALLEVNPQIANVREIPDGALVHIPSHVGHHANNPCGERATLENGESLDQLAWRCGVTLHALLQENPEVRDLGVIKSGLVLEIPDRSSPRHEAPVRWARNEADVMSDATGQAAPRPIVQSDYDAKVAGTDFNATGEIPCVRSSGQPTGSCRFGVVRNGGGNGSITVFWPDGGNRVIFFENLTPMSYDESQADAGAKMTVSQNADLYKVTIGEQRFEIVEAIMSGG